jgi:hypothetical protein
VLVSGAHVLQVEAGPLQHQHQRGLNQSEEYLAAETRMSAFGVQRDNGTAYVQDMTHHQHIDINGETTFSIIDSVADGTALMSAPQTVAASTNYEVDLVVAETFGRNLTVLSTDAGDITIVGKDYLGQEMTETVTCIVGTVAGAKAFKRVTELRAAADLAGDITINVGAEYGLPFCAVEIVREVVNGAPATEGTITAPVTTTPSATTGDVRGTYNPNVAGDGNNDFDITYVTTSRLVGGLYGQAQA